MQEIYKSADYIAMYYKKVNNIGIRRKKPRRDEKSGKQIFTFGAGLGLPEARLKEWGGKVFQNLDEGMTERAAKIWIDGKLAFYM